MPFDRDRIKAKAAELSANRIATSSRNDEGWRTLGPTRVR
jgi:hypothetical protein